MLELICPNVGLRHLSHGGRDATRSQVELGVDSITPLISERSYSHREPAASNKLQHYQKIAVHAAEQCWRQQVTTLHPQATLAAWLQQSQAEIKLIMDENCEQPPDSMPSSVASIDLLVGPEGGFSSQEVRVAQAAGFNRWRLGPRVFRTETAAVSALTVLQYLHGDLSPGTAGASLARRVDVP